MPLDLDEPPPLHPHPRVLNFMSTQHSLLIAGFVPCRPLSGFRGARCGFLAKCGAKQYLQSCITGGQGMTGLKTSDATPPPPPPPPPGHELVHKASDLSTSDVRGVPARRSHVKLGLS